MLTIGADQGYQFFFLGGARQKIMRARAHYERETRQGPV